MKEDRDAQEKHDCPQYCENGSGRNKPFQADVSRRKTIRSRVVVVVTAHGLSRAIDQEVVDQVAAAEKRNFVAVQQAMQPVAEKFGEQAGDCQIEWDSD